MKELARAAFRYFGYRIQSLRHVPRQLQDVSQLRALAFDDLVCRRMFEVGRALTFIQVGAFDGVTKDPLRRYIESCRWRGVMVEPQPQAAAQLRELYAGRDDIEIVEAAIDRQRGARELYVIDVLGAPDWCGGLASFDRATILKHQLLVPGLDKMIRSLHVETRTFDEILDKLDGHEIDVLQLDTEGADALVLSLFPFDRVRPAIVQWEVKHLTIAEREATFERLSQRGYRFAPSTGEDMMASLI